MKNFLVKSLAVVNMGEGIIHIITSLICFWGIADTGTWDWRIVLSPTFDFIMGFASILTSFVLGKILFIPPSKQSGATEDISPSPLIENTKISP